MYARRLWNFSRKKRPPDRQNYTETFSMIIDIRKKKNSVVNEIWFFNSWAYITNDEIIWSILINKIGRNDPHPCKHDPEWDWILPESRSSPKSTLDYSSPSPEK